MSLLIDEKELPQELTAEQAVEAASAAELAEVASEVQRGLPALIECDPRGVGSRGSHVLD